MSQHKSLDEATSLVATVVTTTQKLEKLRIVVSQTFDDDATFGEFTGILTFACRMLRETSVLTRTECMKRLLVASRPLTRDAAFIAAARGDVGELRASMRRLDVAAKKAKECLTSLELANKNISRAKAEIAMKHHGKRA